MIAQSTIDTGIYKYVKLENGLRSIVNYDSKLNSTFIAVTVHTGFYNDPKDYQGLSHFLEHMLFMGSKKYPNVNEFEKYVAENNGSFNASTEDCQTTYFLNILSSKLEQLLDIFSSFFICPLFDEKTITKEINNIESEFKLRYNSVILTIDPIIRKLSDETHPQHNFGCGNKQTLNKPDILKVMKQYYNTWYVANNISVVISSDLKIDVLQKYVTSYFSPVKSKALPVISYKSPFSSLYSKYQMPYVTYTKQTDTNSVIIYYDLPNHINKYDTKPCEIISHFLGHEASGSIFDVLKKRNLATSLIAGSYDNCVLGKLFIAIDLHDDADASKVVQIVFDYITVLSQVSDDVLKNMYNEIRTINTLLFNSETSSDIIGKVANISKNIFDYPVEHVLDNRYYLKEYDESVLVELRQMISLLKNPIIIHTLDESKNDNFETEYHVFSFSLREYDMKHVSDSTFELPKPNQYIPKQVAYGNDSSFDKYPTKQGKVWLQKDNRYKTKKTRVSIMLNVQGDEKYDYILHGSAVLFAKYVLEVLNEELYYIEMAKYNVDIFYQKQCLVISIYGWSDKMNDIIRLIFKTMFESIDVSTLKYVHKIMFDQLTDAINTLPAMTQWKRVSYNVFDIESLDPLLFKRLMNRITPDNIKSLQSLLRKTDYTAYVYGDVSDISPIVSEFITTERKFVKQLSDFKLDSSPFKNVRLCNSNEMGLNKIVSCSYTITTNFLDFETILYNTIFTNIVGEQFFTELRTKREMGYVASIIPKIYINQNDYAILANFVVATSSHTTDEVLKEISIFTQNIQVSESSFTESVLSLEQTLIPLHEEPATIYGRNLKQIQSCRYVFDTNEKLYDKLRYVTYGKFVDFIKTKITLAKPQLLLIS